MKIDIKKLCGKNTVSRVDGGKIHDLIVKAWDKEKQITVDFGGISVASISFLDQVLGILLLKYSQKDVVRKIKVVRMNPFDKTVLNNIMASRLKQAK